LVIVNQLRKLLQKEDYYSKKYFSSVIGRNQFFVGVLPPGIFNLVLALVFSGWVSYARLVRGEVLKTKDREFILAARGFNASALRIACSHMAPLIFPLLLTQAVLGIAGVILLESSLNFLGLGQMIDAGRGHIFVRPSLVILLGSYLVMLIAAFLLLADGIKIQSRTNP
jgi:ABC-type dipeptide/oligopeptide/nickel transport system permease subunit